MDGAEAPAPQLALSVLLDAHDFHRVLADPLADPSGAPYPPHHAAG